VSTIRSAQLSAWSVAEGNVSPSGQGTVSVHRDPAYRQVRPGYSNRQQLNLAGQRNVMIVSPRPSAGTFHSGANQAREHLRRTAVSAPTIPHPAVRRPVNPPGRGVGTFVRPSAGSVADPSSPGTYPTVRPGRLPAPDRPACAATPGTDPPSAIEAESQHVLPATASRAIALASRLSGPEVVSWRYGRPRAARCHICGEQHALSETGRILLRHGAPPCPGTRAPVALIRVLAVLRARRQGGGCRA